MICCPIPHENFLNARTTFGTYERCAYLELGLGVDDVSNLGGSEVRLDELPPDPLLLRDPPHEGANIAGPPDVLVGVQTEKDLADALLRQLLRQAGRRQVLLVFRLQKKGSDL